MIKRGKWGELRVEVGREGDDGVGEVDGVGEGGRCLFAGDDNTLVLVG